jgi:hypothetical protein
MRKPIAVLTVGLTGMTILVTALATLKIASGPARAGADDLDRQTLRPGPLPDEIDRLCGPLDRAVRDYAVLLDRWTACRDKQRRLRDRLAEGLAGLRRDLAGALAEDPPVGPVRIQTARLLDDLLTSLDPMDLQSPDHSWLGRIAEATDALGVGGMGMPLAQMRDLSSQADAVGTQLGRLGERLIQTAGSIRQTAGQIHDQAAERLDAAVRRSQPPAIAEALAHARWARQVDLQARFLQTEARGLAAGETAEAHAERIARLNRLARGPVPAL